MATADPLLLAAQEAASYEDPEVPYVSPHPESHNSLSSTEIANRCAVCTNRQQRRFGLIWAVLLVWAVPLALATGRCYGWWGHSPHTTRQQPQGHLLMVQVLFRHGARTPLSNLYWPNTTWTHCSQQPLPAAPGAAGTSSSSSKGITLQLYDASGAPNPPELSGDDEPQLPGGCRMGHLTDAGFGNALDLGAQLRATYLHEHKLLPPHRLDPALLHAESTAVQRTVTTLRGVLEGLYPNASGVVRVAVRPQAQELMDADWGGCPALADLTARLTDAQKTRDASDPKLQELQQHVRLGLQLPPEAPVVWSRLRDELACMEAEGQAPPAAAAQQYLVQRVEYVTTQHRVEVSAPEPGACLLGRDQEAQCQQVTALTTGRLLHTFTHNMAAAAAFSNSGKAADSAAADGDDGATEHGDGISSSAAAGSQSQEQLQRLVVSRRLLSTGQPTTAAASSAGAGGGSGDDNDSTAAPKPQQPPKLLLFSAHDTTLLPLLSALGQHQTTWPGFASHLAFELWGHKGQFFVRVLHDGQPLKLLLSEGGAEQQDNGAAAGGSSGVQRPTGTDRQGGGAQGVVAQAWQSMCRVLGGLIDAVRGRVSRALAAVDAWLDELAALLQVVVGGGGGAVAGRLRSNGAGEYYTAAYVVTLEDFQQRVLNGYVLDPKQYEAACGAGGGGAVSAPMSAADAQRLWRAQFY